MKPTTPSFYCIALLPCYVARFLDLDRDYGYLREVEFADARFEQLLLSLLSSFVLCLLDEVLAAKPACNLLRGRYLAELLWIGRLFARLFERF